MKCILCLVNFLILVNLFTCQPDEGQGDLFAQVESCMSDYSERSLAGMDTVSQRQNQTEIIDVYAKHNHEKVKRELSRTQNHNLLLAIMVIGLMLLLFFVVYYYIRYRKYKQLELSGVSSELRKKGLELEKRHQEIDTFRVELETSRLHDNVTTDRYTAVENVLRQKEEDLIVIQNQLNDVEMQLNRHKLVSIVKIDLPDVKELDVRALFIFQSLQDNPCKDVFGTSEDWELLFLWTDIAQFRFYTRLKEKYKLFQKRDLQICCLIRLGFDNYEIGSILDIQKSTLYTDKSCTKKKMSLGADVTLEKFLRDF